MIGGGCEHLSIAWLYSFSYTLALYCWQVRSVWLTLPSQNRLPKKWARIDILKPAEPHSPWDASCSVMPPSE